MKSGKTRLVAIVGGSGAGKTWLAQRLQTLLPGQAGLICQDDFYRDRSHLPSSQRDRVNFDHPRAIDWESFEKVLKRCRDGRASPVPRYDFTTHSRTKTNRCDPAPVMLVEGLWLLRRPSLRRLFDLSIFIDCPESTRFERRLKRDQKQRGRHPESIRNQFFERVSPMHDKFVAPQKRWASLVLPSRINRAVLQQLARNLIHPIQGRNPALGAGIRRRNRGIS